MTPFSDRLSGKEVFMSKNKPFRIAALLFSALLFFIPATHMEVYAADAAPTIETTLTDGAQQRGSRKTFDVWARDGAGHKIASTVSLNGETLSSTWDDTDKTSYTLHFIKEGINTVVVSAASGGKTVSKTYRLTYQKAQPGDVIGQATWSVELFTIGCGYLIEPVKRDIREGETAAQELLRLLHDYGFVAFYRGSGQASFYLAYIADGTNQRTTFNGYKNSRAAYGTPPSPKRLNLKPSIPAVLYPHLESSLDFFDDRDYEKWEGTIGEFVFTNGSGWMYSINNIFPNVSFSDSFPSDGDVIRVQFTMAYGADIGGSGTTEGGIPGNNGEVSSFFSVANKDRLTRLAADAGAKRNQPDVNPAYTEAVGLLQTLDASQGELDRAYERLLSALNAALPTAPTDTTAPTGKTGGNNSPDPSAPPTAAPPSADEPESPPSTGNTSGQSESLSSETSGTGEEILSEDTAPDDVNTAGTEPEADLAGGEPSKQAGGSGWIWCLAGGCVLLTAAAMSLVFYMKKKKRLWWKE